MQQIKIQYRDSRTTSRPSTTQWQHAWLRELTVVNKLPAQHIRCLWRSTTLAYRGFYWETLYPVSKALMETPSQSASHSASDHRKFTAILASPCRSSPAAAVFWTPPLDSSSAKVPVVRNSSICRAAHQRQDTCLETLVHQAEVCTAAVLAAIN